MGVIRGVLIVLISVLLFVSLLITGVFVTLSSSLNYDNVQPRVTSIATEIIQEQIGETTIVNTLVPYLEDYCLSNSEITEQFEGYTFVYPCDVVSGGTESIINYSVQYLIGDFYYKEYTCEFWSCLEESSVPLFFVSKYARDYWRSWFLKAFLVSLILTGGIVLLSRRKSRGFVLTGAIVVASSFVVLQLNKIGSFAARAVLSPVSSVLSSETPQSILSDIVGIFFSNSHAIFVWMLIIGLVFVGAGILLRLFRVGFKISNFFQRIESKSVETKSGKKAKK